MQAIIKTGGKQYTVKKGQKLAVEKLEAADGANVDFDVLALIGDELKIGTPLVSGAKVQAKILGQVKADKVISFKFKRRKGYHKTRGHRQKLTEIQIQSINA
jgi:large subunit ribosomal protein L21